MNRAAQPYVPLWCKSHYSFLEGASSPQELVETSFALGLPAIGLCDRNGLYGVVKGHVKARELGHKLILGSEITLDDDTFLLLLVEQRKGYANLCELLTRGQQRAPKGKCVVSWNEVNQHAAGLLALWGGQASLLTREADPGAVADSLKEAFADRLYAMLTRHWEAIELKQEAHLRRHALHYELPLVAGTEVLYHTRERSRLQDVLTCIRHGVTLDSAGRRLKPNSEHDLLSPERFQALFADAPDAVQRTLAISERCRFSLSELRYRYPSESLPDGMTSFQRLRALCYEGARRRYAGAVPVAVRDQIEKELRVIRELDYDGYFLTMRDVVEFCLENDILCQGRGSAANSAVCFCLGITAIDPVRMNLLFERFLSVERAEPPDIDLDIEHDRREEVIQHVYSKYGRSHAAMVANVVRYRSRSAVREIGKALGISETMLDAAAKFLSYWDGLDPSTLRQANIDVESGPWRLLVELVPQVLDFPRHLSIHPGGFLLGHEPVSTLVPIENASMQNRTVIQWDKDDVEALGLFKVDLLGLGALRQLNLAFTLLDRHYGVQMDMATIPPDDAATFAMIGRADTLGVFQIESRAQMAMLPRLRPRNFYDLVIEVSIVRPGPITGGMVHPYLRRRNQEERVDYPHPCLEPVLKKTLGVPLFQEQVMRLAVVAADYTPGEADQLRRDMAAWRRSGRIEKHRERLISRMMQNGICKEFAERVFNQIRGFGEYGFPESHAASFALISYATSWLRCHYPVAFYCSLLNAQPMGFYSVASIVQDARRHDVKVLSADVLRSLWDCTLESAGTQGGYALRMGLRYVNALGRRDWEKIDSARDARNFENVADFVRRTGLSRPKLLSLNEAGAFESLAPTRRESLWQLLGLAGRPQTPLAVEAQGGQPGFARLSRAELIHWDHRASHHSTRGHPLSVLRSELRAQKLPDARSLNRLPDKSAVRYAGLVICRQRPGTASGITFMTLEDETGFVNVVVRKRVFARFAVVAKTASFLGVSGKLQVEGTVVHLVADSLWLPKLSSQPIRSASRDFH
ncbi:MAG: error-prone DNA polymerase [Proteobacteria bacterium]|nr:error-prone DNA polymerase [Pseudomonadota bacterium]